MLHTLLAFDIGNTETTVGLFEGESILMQWRLTTNPAQTADELRFKLIQLVSAALKTPHDITATAICSVVPTMTPLLASACRVLFGTPSLIVDGNSPLPIHLKVDHPSTVGADRVVNTLAASQLYHHDAIVVDLGTATTYDCITGDGTFIGGVIQPGVQTSVDTLVRKTSMLPSTVLAVPKHTIGTNTIACIQSGVMFGAAESIDGIIRRIKWEWPTPTPPHVVATGGLSPMFQELCHEFTVVDPALTLKGIQIAHRLITA